MGRRGLGGLWRGRVFRVNMALSPVVQTAPRALLYQRSRWFDNVLFIPL